MADKVKLSKDGNSIDFVQSESIPTSVKKFRQSPEIEGFYRFIFENDLQKEAFEILERIVNARKSKKKSDKVEATATAQAAKKAEATTKPEVAKKVVLVRKPEPVPAQKAAPIKPVVSEKAKKSLPKAAPKKPAPVVKKKNGKKK